VLRRVGLGRIVLACRSDRQHPTPAVSHDSNNRRALRDVDESILTLLTRAVSRCLSPSPIGAGGALLTPLAQRVFRHLLEPEYAASIQRADNPFAPNIRIVEFFLLRRARFSFSSRAAPLL